MGYLVIAVALAVGFTFAEAPPPGSPSRIAPLHLRMALELSELPSEQVAEEAAEDPVTTLAYGDIATQRLQAGRYNSGS